MKIKLIFLFAFISLFSIGIIYAQPPQSKVYTAIGFEVDALPYVMGGYHGSVWVGSGQIRGRGIVARSTIPEFFVKNGFEDNEIQVFALIGDYFIQGSDFKESWIGVGVEYWDGRVTSKSTQESADYVSYVITAGFGYVWKFYKNFYLNPWLGFHVVAAGDREVTVGATTEKFSNPPVLPEVSVKLGWYFSMKSKTKYVMQHDGNKRKRKKVRVIY